MPKRTHPVALSLPAILLACLVLANPAHGLTSHPAPSASERIVQFQPDRPVPFKAAALTPGAWLTRLVVVLNLSSTRIRTGIGIATPALEPPYVDASTTATVILPAAPTPGRDVTPGQYFGNGAQAAP